ncbi:MAG: hypothetical protein AAGJ52_08445 [Pseudomonadota bacterium]
MLSSSLSAGNEFPLLTGAYLDTEPIRPVGVAFVSDGALVVAMNRGAGSGTETGTIALVDPFSGAVGEVIWSGNPIVDFGGGSGTSSWAAVTANDLILGDLDGLSVEAERGLPTGSSGRAVAVCPGQVALLLDSGSTIVARLEQRDGSEILSSPRGDTAVNDVACDPVSERLFVTGYNQVSETLQRPFIDGLSAAGASDWRAYQNGNPADTSDARGIALRRSDQGELWFASQASGGVSAFRRDPLDPNSNATLVSFDAYNQTFNLGGQTITFYGRFDPQTGALIRGQFQLSRLSNNSGNSVRVSDLDIDGAGRVHVAGVSSASMANRDGLTIQGIAVGAYSGADPSLLVASDDLSSRIHWTMFVDEGGRGSVVAVVTSGDRYAFLVENTGGSLLTFNAAVELDDLSAPPSGGTPYTWLGAWGNLERDAELFEDRFEF